MVRTRFASARLRFAPLLGLALFAAGCGTDPTSTEPDPEVEFGPCDPLVPGHCLLPWPNDFFTVEDETSATGRRLALAPGLSFEVPALAPGLRERARCTPPRVWPQGCAEDIREGEAAGAVATEEREA